MSKRNTFLDGDEEDDDVSIHSDVEDVRDSRFASFKAKRRKLSLSEDEGLSGEDSEEGSEADEDKGVKLDGEKERHAISADPKDPDEDEEERELEDDPHSSRRGPVRDEKRKILRRAKLEKAQAKVRKTGVIYISRVPPFMKPATLRQLLTPYGTILRIFLTPEATPRYKARVKAGGNKKKSFVDGWVEFESKKKAKVCADALNGNIVGGKKGGFYHDDVWNIKYLKGFKWNDLMEQVQGEEREREGKLQAEIERERRERKVFLQNAERAKVERGMEAKRGQRAAAVAATADGEGGETKTSYEAAETRDEARNQRREMTFKQNTVRSGKQTDTATSTTSRALSKIF